MEPSCWMFLHPHSPKPPLMQISIQDWCWRSNSIDLKHCTYISTFIWSIYTCGFKDSNPLKGFQYNQGELFHLLCLLILQFQLHFKVYLKLGFNQREHPSPQSKQEKLFILQIHVWNNELECIFVYPFCWTCEIHKHKFCLRSVGQGQLYAV